MRCQFGLVWLLGQANLLQHIPTRDETIMKRFENWTWKANHNWIPNLQSKFGIENPVNFKTHNWTLNSQKDWKFLQFDFKLDLEQFMWHGLAVTEKQTQKGNTIYILTSFSQCCGEREKLYLMLLFRVSLWPHSLASCDSPWQSPEEARRQNSEAQILICFEPQIQFRKI